MADVRILLVECWLSCQFCFLYRRCFGLSVMGCLNNAMFVIVGKFGVFVAISESLLCVVCENVVRLFIRTL